MDLILSQVLCFIEGTNINVNSLFVKITSCYSYFADIDIDVFCEMVAPPSLNVC